jgi:hypothetical protein
MKVARGDVTSAEAARYFLGWFLNIFCLVTPFMILFITVLGLPLLAALRRIGFASVLGALLSGQLVAACFSLCFSSDYISNAVLAGLLTMGFVLAARLPWLRSPAMPANQRLERPVKWTELRAMSALRYLALMSRIKRICPAAQARR